MKTSFAHMSFLLNLHIVFVQCAFPLAEIVPPLGKISVYSGPDKTELLVEMLEQPTVYGVTDTVDDVEGYVVAAEPPNGCGFLDPPPGSSRPQDEDDDTQVVKNFIVLVSMDQGCDFEKKIKNAVEAGFSAIIIHNIESNGTIVIPKTDDLPAFFVGESDGWSLRDNHSFPIDHFIRIERPDLFWGKFRAFGVWIASGIAILGISTFIVLMAFRTVKYAVIRWGNNCGVCREPLPRSDGNSMLARLHVLPCSHKFHAFCMMPYSSSIGICCPICSQTFSYDSHSSSGEQGRGSSGESYGDSRTPFTTPHEKMLQEQQQQQQRIERTRVELHDEAGSGMISSQVETPSRASTSTRAVAMISHSHPGIVPILAPAPMPTVVIETETETASERQPLLPPKEKEED